MRRGLRCLWVLCALTAGCSPDERVRVEPVPASDGGPGGSDPLHLVAPVFQPGFHQALRATHWRSGPTTFRFVIPVARGGARARVAFRAGDGRLRLLGATIAPAGSDGEPVPLTFEDAAGAELERWDRAVSDPVDFEVVAQQDVLVTFEAEGALAASAIDAFPGSLVDGAVRWHRLVGVQTIEVEAPPSRAFVAIGDSITEGYVDGEDDHRRGWPYLAGAMIGEPVVNAAVSGQGLWAANEHREDDVGVLEGITDCAVLLGTNDLAASPSATMIERLTSLFEWLEDRGCRVWAGTLLPKEKTSSGDLTLVNARRRKVNAWIRSAPVHAVIDFEAAVAAPDDVNRFDVGLVEDGIHPTYKGQRLMAEEAARAFSAAR